MAPAKANGLQVDHETDQPAGDEQEREDVFAPGPERAVCLPVKDCERGKQ